MESSTPDKMYQILNVLDAIKLNQDNYTIRLGKIEVTQEVYLLNRSFFIYLEQEMATDLLTMNNDIKNTKKNVCSHF